MTFPYHMEKPLFLLLLLPLIPAIITAVVRYRHISDSLVQLEYEVFGKRTLSLKKRLVGRVICWSLAYACLVFALSGPYRGSRQIAVQKSGTAVSFVFDISYSMLAKDVLDLPDATRLEAAQLFANSLLDRLGPTAVSTVIAKGSGITVVPLTEDQFPTRSLIEVLSPTLITSAGSNLSSGIEAAVRSFPAQSSFRETIVLFTDGDETSNSDLKKATLQAAKNGITVIFVGFGSETETEVLTGDGATTVKTALRSLRLNDIAENTRAELKLARSRLVWYIPAYQKGAALAVLKLINGAGLEQAAAEDSPELPDTQEELLTGYEIEDIGRYPFYLALALIFFGIGFLFAEYNQVPLFQRGGKNLALLVLLFPLFSGCGFSMQGMAGVLQSTINWHQKQYQRATAGFLSIYETNQDDFTSVQYSLYGLATSYLMQNEDNAALARFEEIAPDAPDHILFAMYYNEGVVHYRKANYEEAADCFKKALLIDSTCMEAKINMELALRQQTSLSSTPAEQEMVPASESKNDPSLNDVIFSVIRESEKNRWQSPEFHTSAPSSVLDY